MQSAPKDHRQRDEEKNGDFLFTVPRVLKGFYVIRVEKKETTPYGPITSGGGYRVSCVLYRSKTGMTLRNRPAKTKGPIDTNCAG